jgi:energy-coupling factor transport system ATP-binding protein
VIRARGLGWRYAGRPVAALHDVEFELADGACLLVAGPSGAGKSTLALAIAGLIPHESAGTWSGELEVAGLSVARSPRTRLADNAGILFQEAAAQLVMEAIEDDVAFGLENRAWERAAMRQRVAEILVELGVATLARRRSVTLSGGEQQRVALAGVLAPRPQVLVLDEPTANLDPAGSAAFYEALARLRSGPRPPTIVLIEHRVDLALPFVDRLLALDAGGGPIASGPAGETFAAAHDQLAAAGIWTPGEAAARIARAITARRTDGHVSAPLSAPPLVEAVRLGHRYGDGPPALRDVTLRICAGERAALVGANGSGKSTLARLMAGLMGPREGSVSIGGADPARLPARELPRHAGYVFQDPAVQFLTGRVGDELHVGLRTPDEHAAADRLLAELDLERPGLRGASPYTLSGGEQRRLSVACALVREPSLLVLDEPTYGQDRAHYAALLALIRERVGGGAALLAATHDLVFAAEASARAIGLREGRLAWDGPIADLLGDPAVQAELALASPVTARAAADTASRGATGAPR